MFTLSAALFFNQLRRKVARASEAERKGIEIHWATAYGMYRAIAGLIRPT
jgi:hypothetical protein